MRKINNLKGQRFGRLLVLEIAGRDKYGNVLWLCACDCGNKTIVNRISLIATNSNKTRSCGCLRKELVSERVSGDKCPLAQPDIIAKRTGDLSPTKRPEVRKKMSNSLLGRYCGELAPAWKGGKSFEPYCPKFNNDLKERIRAYFDYKCIICGKSQEDNGMKLDCHHVDYDKQACCNNKNIIYFALLCRSCHIRTNNNRKYWEHVLVRIIDELYDGRSYLTKEEMSLRLNNQNL